VFRFSHILTPMQAVLLLAAVCASGCDRPRPRAHYSVLSGKVIACHTDTGELSVRVSRRRPEGPSEETVYCLITRDAEIYINDKVSSIHEIQLGDAVELIGRRDPDSQIERFVVSFAYFDHPLPPPPPPDLTPAAAPATDDPKDQPEPRED
jgi:hypothetical protein